MITEQPQRIGHWLNVIPETNQYHFHFDHHMIDNFNTCDRYFQFRHMPDDNGMVWGSRGWSSSMQIGIWWSRVMELFYREMSYGSIPDSAYMQKFAADAWTEMQMDVNLKKHDPDYYDKFRGAEGALLMALEYYESFAEIDFKAWRIVGAEKGFGMDNEVFIGQDDEVIVHYMGRPDLIILENSSQKLLPLDFKTKDRVPYNVNELYKPHPQTAGYIYAVNQMAKKLGLSTKDSDRCIVRVCSRLRPTDKPRSGVKAPRFVNVYPSYSLDELEEWRESIMAKARRLKSAMLRNEFVPRESACHMYSGCSFRGVCNVPRGSREIVLRANFTKIEPWVPYDSQAD